MPRYHFHVYDGHSPPDQDGTELRDWHEARREAVRFTCALLDAEADNEAPGELWRMEVTDDAGLMLFRLDFSILESAAIVRSKHRG